MTAPFVVRPGEGDARWVTGSLDTVLATAERTGGLLGLIESTERRGDAPPFHVHSKEDEGYYVIEGELTFFFGDETVRATTGSFVFAPRNIPHTYRVESSTSRIIAINMPGGWEGFFAEAGDPAAGKPEPPDAEPGFERLSGIASRYGVTIVGDPPALP
jgi:mannose-6-phosphate isomerase-like protein (cupin superfamily)